mmetsp:Transcript_6065/g.13862  ORF Transcript_6065/g.13862 Transcript_6065/m.13862 type:complete len:596 (+) Transcript_6065:61-1848(+)
MSFFPQAARSRPDSSESPRQRRRSVSPTKSGRHSEKSPRAANEFVQTAVRLRPFLPNELSKSGSAPQNCVEIKPTGHVILYDPEKPQQPGREFECTFAFDSSRPKSENYADQGTIYNSVGAEMVMQASTGFNCCLVAYGQTGTGKTHTVHGDWNSPEQRGFLPRISEGLFERLDHFQQEGASWRVRIAYIEVYNDRLRDLLGNAGPRVDPDRFSSDPGPGPGTSSPRRMSKPGTAAGSRLEIRNHPAVGVYVENLQELPVENLKDVARLVSKGEKAKKVERTTMNDRSSRSHTIFMFKVEVRNSSHGDFMSTMQVVDLAGRENEQTSECKGDRFRELRHINRSLFDLASCIHALCDGNRDHVPFRNSKLTMLLSDSLASNCRTTLFATLTPTPTGFDENILTCRFLESTGQITTQPVVNRFGAAEVQKHLQDEIANLQSTLVEEAVIASRQTLLKQFTLVWSDNDLQAILGAPKAGEEGSRMNLVQGACRQVATSLEGAEQSLSLLEERNQDAAHALHQVGRKLATVEKALRGAQSRKARAAGYSPASTATSADERVPGDALRRSLGFAVSKPSPRQPKAATSAKVTLPPLALAS